MPYPRPTSPLTFEPLQLRPDENLLDDSSSEDEQQRAQKRRRIEKCGQDYLQGRSLFIQSAGLKGPLGDGWRNPWRKRPKEDTRTAKEGLSKLNDRTRVSLFVPETVPRRVDHEVIEVEDSSSRSDRSTHGLEGFPNLANMAKATDGKDISEKAGPRTKSHEEARKSSPQQQPAQPSPILPPSSNPFQSKAVAASVLRAEDWLRTNRKLSRTSEHRAPSPTPNPAPRSKLPIPRPERASSKEDLVRDEHNVTSKMDAQRIKSYSAFTPINEPTRQGSTGFVDPPKVTIVKPNTEHSHDELAEMATKAVESLSQSRPVEEVPFNVPVESYQAAKIELGKSMLNKKRQDAQSASPSRPNTSQGLPGRIEKKFKTATARRSLHTVPPSTNLPEFEYRPRAPAPSKATADRTAKDVASSSRDVLPDEPRKPRRMVFNSSGETLKEVAKERVEDKPTEVEQQGREAVPLLQSEDAAAAEVPQNTSTERARVVDQPPPPTLSTETSKTETASVTNMPSAQVVPQHQMAPPPFESHPSNDPIDTGDKIPDVIPANEERVEDSIMLLSTQAAVARAIESFQADIITPMKEVTSQGEAICQPPVVQQCNTDGITPFAAFNTPSPARRRPQPATVKSAIQSTQAMMDAMTPFAFSTAKKAPLKPACEPSQPSSKAKSTARRKQKRASFAPPSPPPAQSMLKSSLRVTKPHSQSSSNDSNKEPTEPSPFGKLGFDMDTSPEGSPAGSPRPASPKNANDSLPSLSSLLHPRHQAESTALAHPQSAISATVPFTLTAGSAPMSISTPCGGQQDGQRVPDPLPYGDDDLENDIDDIGSFLTSWDPEKELRSIASGSVPVKSSFKKNGKGSMSARYR